MLLSHLANDKDGRALREPMARRRFVRQLVGGTALSALAGRLWTESVLADCGPAEPGTGVMRVRIGDYAALGTDGGSIRLAIHPFTQNGPLGPLYPIIINRETGQVFHALSAQCTHFGCVVEAFSVLAGACVCRCHGSQFAIDGGRISGPASSALTRYEVGFGDDDLLCVRIPDSLLHVEVRAAASAGPWLQLRFPTVNGAKYEVLRHETVQDPGSVTSFSMTPDGPSMEELTGNGSETVVLVERTGPAGFLTVALKATAG